MRALLETNEKTDFKLPNPLGKFRLLLYRALTQSLKDLKSITYAKRRKNGKI
jgi:hypothetical protein